MKLVGRSGEWADVLAFLHFNASPVGVAEVRLLADASGGALAFQAFPGDLRFAVDHEWQGGVAAGQAVQLLAARAENFAVAGALTLRLHGRGVQGDVDGLGSFAVSGWYAHAVGVLQESFLAEASDDALSGADRAGMRVGAGGWASGTARVEHFVFTAFRGWWQHHERGVDWVDFRALLRHDALAVGARAEMSWLAGAAGNADAWADGIGVVAGAVAALALTEFFVVAAHLGWQRHSFGGRNAAAFRWHALAVFVFQVAGFAEATDDALEGAHRAGVRVGAGRGAGGSARQENFVFFALRDLRRVGEEHWARVSIALSGWHAETAFVSQVAGLAEASDDAVLGADGARMGVGAGRGAGRAAGLEFFIVGALGNFEVHGGFLGSGLAFMRAHAFTLGVLQESLFTETADDALEGTNCGFFRMGASWCACGTACLENGMSAAFLFWKSRDGDSEPEGANAEQQRESKARVHR